VKSVVTLDKFLYHILSR